jgi:hypothetical protein
MPATPALNPFAAEWQPPTEQLGALSTGPAAVPANGKRSSGHGGVTPPSESLQRALAYLNSGGAAAAHAAHAAAATAAAEAAADGEADVETGGDELHFDLHYGEEDAEADRRTLSTASSAEPSPQVSVSSLPCCCLMQRCNGLRTSTQRVQAMWNTCKPACLHALPLPGMLCKLAEHLPLPASWQAALWCVWRCLTLPLPHRRTVPPPSPMPHAAGWAIPHALTSQAHHTHAQPRLSFRGRAAACGNRGHAAGGAQQGGGRGGGREAGGSHRGGCACGDQGQCRCVDPSGVCIQSLCV